MRGSGGFSECGMDGIGRERVCGSTRTRSGWGLYLIFVCEREEGDLYLN
jgi:hypothetical protein